MPVVDVVSSSTRTMDLVEKAEDYRQAGIPEYSAVHVERGEIILHRLAGRTKTGILPGYFAELLGKYCFA